jgi:probable F420-dependent oxidoreductase
MPATGAASATFRCGFTTTPAERLDVTSPSFGLALPQTFLDGRVDLASVRRVLARAETLGFHSVWVQEQILGSTPSLEPVELLTYAAALSERVKLGAAVLLTTLRGPLHLAKSLATLDQLSQGRLIVGVGLGGNLPLYPAYGISTDHRVTRFVEGIQIMKALWTKPSTTFTGRFWRLDDATMEPKPVQHPHPPLWFGAHCEAAIERSAELGDGFIGAGSSSVEEFAGVVARLRAALERRGRDPGSFPVSKRVYIAVDEDEGRAVRRLEEWFGRFYRDPTLARRVAVWGSPDRCVESLARVADAGARLVVLNPVYDEGDQVDRLAGEVVPRVLRA